MCLIFLAVNHHPNYKLIVAGNRDEFYSRKTAAADFWKDDPNILGGRDLEAGGSWLAMSRKGKISMLTNFRDLRNIKAQAPSRGHLVSDFLSGSEAGQSYMKIVEKKGALYNGFNLILGTVDELWYLSNYAQGIKKLNGGFFGLSNHLLNTPWPKVETGRKKLEALLMKENLEPDPFFSALYDNRISSDELLPDTGIGLERERALSAMFIKTPDYGSRCSTVILVDRKNHVSFTERVYDLKTFEYATRDFEFDIES